MIISFCLLKCKVQLKQNKIELSSIQDLLVNVLKIVVKVCLLQNLSKLGFVIAMAVNEMCEVTIDYVSIAKKDLLLSARFLENFHDLQYIPYHLVLFAINVVNIPSY